MVILLVSLIFYYFLCKQFSWLSLKCLFFEITGVKCPGCGITRMIFSFMELKFFEGIQYNYFLGMTSFILIGIFCYLIYSYLYEIKNSKTFDVLCFVYIALLIVWGIVRNVVGV